MSGKIEGKVAVVTGASKGIGAGIALELAREGAAVVVNYARDREGAERVVSEIRSREGRAIAVQADVSRQEEVQQLFAETRNAYGKVDLLVNNAGVYEFAPLEQVTAIHFHRLFDINVLGLLLATQEAVRHFGPDGGGIINISSVVTSLTPPHASVYSGTKAAVDAITRSLAKELGPRKIRVNSINPGMVETEGTHSAGILESDMRRGIEKDAPLGRIGQPRDIAPAVAFLASEESSWVTGEIWTIAGGIR